MLRRNVKLAEILNYEIGGVANYFFEPSSVDELSEARKLIAQQSLKYFFVGAGTNTLVSSADWDGAVLSFAKLDSISFLNQSNSDAILNVGAGVDNSEFAKFAADHSLDGAAWMYRLPGQIGATVRMNARCYGGEISQIVVEVTAVNESGEIITITDPAMFKGYKDTVFMTNTNAIAEVKIKLIPGNKSKILEQMNFCETDRLQKHQFDFKSCGCVFKNNYAVGVPSGMLLEASGVKELKHPRLTINPWHANFVFNTGGATSEDVIEFTIKMREAVYQKFGVWLEYEMEILGDISLEHQMQLSKTMPPRWTQHGEDLRELRGKFKSARH